MDKIFKPGVTTVTFFFCAVFSFAVFISESMVVFGYKAPFQSIKIFPSSARVSDLTAISKASLFTGNSLSDINKKVFYYCQSLAALGQALSYTPFDGKLLLNWANVRQLLGKVGCQQAYTTGDLPAVVELGLKGQETNPAVIYSGGLLATWSGNLELARKHFRRFLNYEINPTPGQNQLIQSTIVTPAHIEEAIPARFPQVISWTARLREDPRLWYSSQVAQESKNAIKKLLLSALTENRKLFLSGTIPDHVYEGNLEYILREPLDDEVRRVVDSETASYVIRNNAAHKYFLERSGLHNLKIARSFIPGDRKPQRSNFVTWSGEQFASFDEPFNSVGFYLADGQMLSSILIRGNVVGPTPQPKHMRIYTSEDNTTWEELSVELKYSSFMFHDYPHLVIEIPKTISQKKYWKIQFDRAGNIRKFGDSLPRFISAYGTVTE